MTKKDYLLIAGAIKKTFEELQEKQGLVAHSYSYEPIETFLNKLCIELKNDNIKFDKKKFLTACGVD